MINLPGYFPELVYPAWGQYVQDLPWLIVDSLPMKLQKLKVNHNNQQIGNVNNTNLEEESDEQTDGEVVSALTGRVDCGLRNCLVVVLGAFLQQTTKTMKKRF